MREGTDNSPGMSRLPDVQAGAGMDVDDLQDLCTLLPQEALETLAASLEAAASGAAATELLNAALAAEKGAQAAAEAQAKAERNPRNPPNMF